MPERGVEPPAQCEAGECDIRVPAQRGSCDDDPVVVIDRHGVGDAAVREGGLDPIVAEERIQYAGVGPCDSPDEHHDERDGDERGTAHVGLRPPVADLRNDLGDRQLQDVRGAGRFQLRDQRVYQALLHHRLDRVAAFG